MQLRDFMSSIVIPVIISIVFGVLSIAIDKLDDPVLTVRVMVDALAPTIIAMSIAGFLDPKKNDFSMMTAFLIVALISFALFYLIYRLDWQTIWKIVMVFVSLVVLALAVAFETKAIGEKRNKKTISSTLK